MLEDITHFDIFVENNRVHRNFSKSIANLIRKVNKRCSCISLQSTLLLLTLNCQEEQLSGFY